MRKTKKRNFISENYYESWRYLKDSKNFIFGIIGVFLVFTLMGFLFPVFFAEEVLKLIRELISLTEGMNGFEITVYIFFNNLKASFIGLFTGIFFGIVPLFNAILNGYVIGFVSNLVVGEVGFGSLWRLVPHGIFELPALFISLGLGIRFGVEFFRKVNDKVRLIVFYFLLFLLFSVSFFVMNLFDILGFLRYLLFLFSIILLSFAIYACSFIFNKKDRMIFHFLYFKNLRVFVFIVVPLLILAAIIEGSLITFFP